MPQCNLLRRIPAGMTATKALHLFKLQPGLDLFGCCSGSSLSEETALPSAILELRTCTIFGILNTGYPCWKCTHIRHIHIWNFSTYDTQPMEINSYNISCNRLVQESLCRNSSLWIWSEPESSYTTKIKRTRLCIPSLYRVKSIYAASCHRTRWRFMAKFAPSSKSWGKTMSFRWPPFGAT